PQPERTVALAARMCYSDADIDELSENMSDEKVRGFLQRLVDLGHESPIEHASFTFAIEGISRACSHQLVRHRLASYSQKSQRYVKEDQFQYVIPPSYADKGMEDRFEERMKIIQQWYNEDIEAGIPKEDARYNLPNACQTQLMVTMNARELWHFFRLRCCLRAQWEIRAVAESMLGEAKKVAPLLFEKAGPACVYGPCSEGKMNCGKSKEVRARYRAMRENGDA
ncbi:MAG: thymidylate synthase, partial [Clostridiales bacterium]|nr:thymidylate synthase [Clostridiales bacterium]